MFEVQRGQSLSASLQSSGGMRPLTRAEIEAVSGGDTISCIWVCQPVPEPVDPPAVSAGLNDGGTHYDCQLLCDGNFEPGDDYPPI